MVEMRDGLYSTVCVMTRCEGHNMCQVEAVFTTVQLERLQQTDEAKNVVDRWQMLRNYDSLANVQRRR